MYDAPVVQGAIPASVTGAFYPHGAASNVEFIEASDATHAFLGDLLAQLGDIPKETPLALYCGSGSRSAIGVSLLQAAGFADVAQTRDELLEWDYGDYEGRRTAEIREEAPGWTIFRDDAPNGETAEQVGARVDGLLEEVRAVDGDVLLFAHGHVLRVLTARWLGLDARDGRLFALDPATLSRLGYERETSVLRLWNGHSA